MSSEQTENTISATVLCGSRNIFTVRQDKNDDNLECRLKGKILKDAAGLYNPLAPGDRVSVCLDSAHPGTGMIVALEKRKNIFSRFNQKGNCPQLIAANIDMVACLVTKKSPPFRPRFLDRVLLQADIAKIDTLIVCNKIDLDTDNDDDIIDANERLEDLRRIGYDIIEVSTKTGSGIEQLRKYLLGKRSVFTGQSGVGKSSILNALVPGLNIKTGPVNEKYDRGNHTTTLASVTELSGDTWIIDTPGVRRFVPDGISKDELIFHMREFAPLAGKCTYGLSCSHRHEPGCKIMEAVHAGVIHEDRYESFLRIFDELAGKNNAD